MVLMSFNYSFHIGKARINQFFENFGTHGSVAEQYIPIDRQFWWVTGIESQKRDKLEFLEFCWWGISDFESDSVTRSVSTIRELLGVLKTEHSSGCSLVSQMSIALFIPWFVFFTVLFALFRFSLWERSLIFNLPLLSIPFRHVIRRRSMPYMHPQENIMIFFSRWESHIGWSGGLWSLYKHRSLFPLELAFRV